jgi:hypothetical protein
VIGNAPLLDVMLEYDAIKRSLRDYFNAQSIDALKPGGILALVTSQFAFDEQMDYRTGPVPVDVSEKNFWKRL